jgi:serine/threonine-protein kinase
VPPRARNADIPESVEAVILKALEKEADRRFQSAAEMRTALRSMSSASTFPPRPTTAIGVAPSTLAPAPKQPTTFKTASGEMAPIGTIVDGPAGVGKRRRAGVVIAGIAGAAVIAVVSAIAVKGGKPTDVATPPAPAATAPAAAAPPPATIAPAPREAPAPTEILVRLGSEPAGALVTDAKRGVVIGATPFEQRVARKDGALGVRVAKDGYASVDLDIPLDGDFEKTVRLEPKPQEKPRHGSSRPAAHKPSVAAKATAPAAAPTAPPAVTPPPPAPKPKAEKW